MTTQPANRKLTELQVALAAHFPVDNGIAHPVCVIVAGSGLNALPTMVEKAKSVPYSELPHVGGATVVGHSGELVVGTVAGKPVVVMGGRRHPYEGIEVDESVLLLRAVIAHFGLKIVVLSNAAGGLNPSFELGDLMLVRDHINFMFRNPLTGPTDGGERFPDMSKAYSPRMLALARQAAVKSGLNLREGVYVAGKGPSYETRAEMSMFRHVIGADTVGMSTVHETIAAVQAGCEVLAISVVTNLLPPVHEVTHEEVTTVGKTAGQRTVRLLTNLLPLLSE